MRIPTIVHRCAWVHLRRWERGDGMYDYRAARPGDLDLICHHRHEMFKASGRTDEMVAPMTRAFRPWLDGKLKAGDYFGWIALDASAPIAGLGMMVLDWPPHPSHPLQDRRGYILNMYVEPGHRGRGVAKALMALAMKEGRHRGLNYMVLHATAMGRPLYESLGWQQTSEMAIGIRS